MNQPNSLNKCSSNTYSCTLLNSSNTSICIYFFKLNFLPIFMSIKITSSLIICFTSVKIFYLKLFSNSRLLTQYVHEVMLHHLRTTISIHPLIRVPIYRYIILFCNIIFELQSKKNAYFIIIIIIIQTFSLWRQSTKPNNLLMFVFSYLGQVIYTCIIS